jgi:hypothetical protein
MLIFAMATGTVWAASNSNLIIHSVESTVNEDGNSYTVTIRVSAVSDRGGPIAGLTTRDLRVTEDDIVMELDSVEWVEDAPMSVWVVLDNGATMQGERFRMAQEGVTDFIKDLFRGDRVAVYAYNTAVDQIVSPTDDINQARDEFENARLSPGGGACLFDAVHTALDAATAQSSERQAIVLLSSRKDTKSGYDNCSSVSISDVLTLIESSEKQIPIYAIGVGVDTDEAALQQLADASNGIYSSSTSNYDLPDLFKAVTNRFASEYLITYTSENKPGTHTLSVQLDNQSNSVDIELPGLPPVVRVASPTSLEEFEAGPTKVVLSLVERGIVVDSLTFKINDVPIGVGGKIGQPPYEYEIDFGQYEGEQAVFTILAQDEDGKALSETVMELDFRSEEEIAAAEIEGTDPGQPEQTETETAATCPEGMICLGNLRLTTLQLALIGGGLILLIVALVVIPKLIKKKRKPEQQAEKVSLFDDATLDGFALPNADMGRLTILSSDDPLMVGKEFQLTKSPTTIGRSVNNDIALPKDSAVSRQHLSIIAEGSDAVLQEVLKTLSDGTKQPPTYGTYVNDRKVTDDTKLNNGDEISLGRRTKLRYECNPKFEDTAGSEDVTMDQIALPNTDQVDDSTMDA